MPELPEAEVVARQVRAAVTGATLRWLWIGREDIVRQGFSHRDWYSGATISAVERRGKSVVLTFVKAGQVRYLVAELGMTGLLQFAESDTPVVKHTHVRMHLSGGRRAELRYWNPRRFGRVYLLDAEGLAAFTARRFGVDPLSIDREEFWRLLHARRARLKALLMHQQVIAGIGNIYANEMLFRARLHPHRLASRLTRSQARRLYEEMQQILRAAIEAGGSSVRDFFAPDGQEGQYKRQHVAYNKAGEPCAHGCGATIRTMRNADRASFYCPRCQRR